MTNLPPNVYRVEQRAFDAIPGSPWVYWIPDGLREIFETLPKLGDVAPPRVGLQTGDNARFLRYWWEVGPARIGFGCQNREEAQMTGKKWFPIIKGSRTLNWAGIEYEVVNWAHDGKEMTSFDGAVIRNPDFYFRNGLTLTRVGPSGFSTRINPGGCLLDSSNTISFPRDYATTFTLLGVLNSGFVQIVLKAINPTINFQVGDLINLPVPIANSDGIIGNVARIVRLIFLQVKRDETTYDFIAPACWDTGLAHPSQGSGQALAALEAQIDNEVYRLYDISDEDRAAIEAELAGGNALSAEDEDERETSNIKREDEADESDIVNPKSEIENRQELAVRWISYAVGIVLGRFTIDDLRLTSGDPEIVNRQSKIGNGIYRREAFAVGSLPAPSAAGFDELVGPPERFAYVDEAGGQHVFPAEVEAALRALALPDGIAVLDEGHPRDLPALVEQALTLMLDFRLTILDLRLPEADASSSNRKSSIVNRQSAEVIRVGAGGDLRAFLSRDFFTKWHLRWYRKRPAYWPLQSAKRSYGFVLFHEKVEQYTLYTLMRDYLDYKRNGVQLALGDLAQQREAQSGAARKRTERRIAELTAQQAELAEFAKTLDRLARAGYEPAPDWMDDGVLLRLAPLWEVIPLWKSEPRKAWEALEAGKYDWSHIALRYWPERVKAACRENKSYAIAHGLGDF